MVEEYKLRLARISQRATEKYGPSAMDPRGVLAFDALDYAINELVGLDRYAEMLLARLDRMELSYECRIVHQDTIREVQQSAKTDACRLIFLRQDLLKKGLSLGQQEFAL